MKKNNVITVQNIAITVALSDVSDYICITDMAAAKSDSVRAADVIQNWLRNRSTLEFLATWEEIYNPDFKVFESEHFKKDAGLLTFTPSVSEWVEQTGAIGLYVKKGRYGGTYAHKDIAFEFASAISPVFKLYLIKEFQRLKEEENNLQKIEWDAKRFLSKNNYLIQTDGATIANVGADKQISYTILPGKGLDAEITADVTDFEMDAAAWQVEARICWMVQQH